MSTPESRLATITSKTFLFLTTFRLSQDKVQFELPWVRQRIQEIFEEQKREASRDPQLYKLYEKAHYLLAVAVDGVILNSSWPERTGWTLLETEEFGTSIGGEEFFQRLRDPAYKDPELLEVFFLCLSVGFAGKYFNQPEELAEIRQDLFLRLSDVPRDMDDQVTPTVYGETQGEDFTSMPVENILKLATLVVGVLILLAVGSKVFYSASVSDITEQAEQLSNGQTRIETED
jgi:type VI secretion system protein ImpK